MKRIFKLQADWGRQTNNQAPFLKTTNADRNVPLMPLFQLTGQKIFFLGDKFKATVGTQVSTNPFRRGSDFRLSHFTYDLWV